MNLNNKNLQICSTNPMTGWHRNGFCSKDHTDAGSHTVCAKLSKQFMDFSRDKGNNLYSVAKPGDNWCLCEKRWEEAYDNNVAPNVVLESTNYDISPYIKKFLNFFF